MNERFVRAVGSSLFRANFIVLIGSKLLSKNVNRKVSQGLKRGRGGGGGL